MQYEWELLHPCSNKRHIAPLTQYPTQHKSSPHQTTSQSHSSFNTSNKTTSAIMLMTLSIIAIVIVIS
jgi:hypothetical protein